MIWFLDGANRDTADVDGTVLWRAGGFGPYSVIIERARPGGPMQTERPKQLIDPVCGMTVDVAEAESAGLLIEAEDRTYAFCRAACRSAFLADPMKYIAAAQVASVGGAELGTVQVIDEGMRRWYESCSCCLSDAYPDIKATLDAERAAASAPPVGEGICEVAEREDVAAT